MHMNSLFCAWDIIQTFGSDFDRKRPVPKLYYRYEAALFLQESSKTLQEKGDVDSSKLFLEQVFTSKLLRLIVSYKRILEH